MAKPSLLLVVLVSLALVGCGGDGEETGFDRRPDPAGGGGTLAYAVPELPAGLDPLAASSRAAQLVVRQLHEPLVANLTGPYDARDEHPGLALSLEPSPDRSVWRLILRSDVRFQDGTPFNARAVLANGRRWGSVARGRRLLPGLFAVDAPRPGEVRFQFSGSRPDLPELLASPRLAIVSPDALVPRSGERARFRAAATGTGSGPFALSSRGASTLALDRDLDWWGTTLGLGPSLDQISFTAVPDADERLSLLSDGTVQAAESLGAAGAAAVASDPLLRSTGRGRGATGFEASVRGLDQDSAVPVLSSVWLTTIAD